MKVRTFGCVILKKKIEEKEKGEIIFLFISLFVSNLFIYLPIKKTAQRVKEPRRSGFLPILSARKIIPIVVTNCTIPVIITDTLELIPESTSLKIIVE